MDLKTCIKCGVVKKQDEFRYRKDNKKYKPNCIKCENQSREDNYYLKQKNEELIKENKKKCSYCKEIKEINDFESSKRECKECVVIILRLKQKQKKYCKLCYNTKNIKEFKFQDEDIDYCLFCFKKQLSKNNQKVCTNCNIIKNIKDYHFRDKKNKTLHSECKECINERARTYKSKHYERARESDRKSKIKHYDKVRLNRIMGTSKRVDLAKGVFNEKEHIDKMFIIDTLIEQKDKCDYCSKDITLSCPPLSKNLASVERKDNSLGHIKSNCVMACVTCNSSRANRYTYEKYKEIKRSEASNKWLDKIEETYEVKLEREYRIPNSRYSVDGYDPNTKTVYEYHGNPKIYEHSEINCVTKTTFCSLFKKILYKEMYLKIDGYKYICEWEYDFLR